MNKGFVGSFHAAIVCSKSQQEVAEKLLKRIRTRAIEMEGTATGEHGIGLGLRDILIQEVGDAGVDMIRKVIKQHSRLLFYSRTCADCIA
jgi:D-lactate dehydrogenase (cytochrome)